MTNAMPMTTPTEPSPPPIDTSTGDSPSQFDGAFESDFDSIEVPSREEPAAAPAPPSGPQPQSPPAAAPTATPAAAEPPPVAQPASTPAPTPAQAGVIEEPSSFLESWQQAEAALVQRFAAEQFALSDEDVTALQTNPEQVIPVLAGRVLYKAVAAAQRLMMEQVPMMIAQQTATVSAQRRAEGDFFTQYPELKDPALLGEIQQVVNVMKQLKPQQSVADRIKEVGDFMLLRKGIVRGAAAAPSAQVPGRSPGPAGTVVARESFQPAAARSAPSSAPSYDQSDPFAGALFDWGD